MPDIQEVRNSRMQLWETLHKEENKPLKDVIHQLSNLLYLAGKDPIMQLTAIQMFLESNMLLGLRAISTCVALTNSDITIKEMEKILFEKNWKGGDDA